MEKKVLGLDIGISSVGWGILNLETREVIDAGVRLFPEGDSKTNEKRRLMRGSRRLIRRRKHRIERMTNLLKEYNIISDDFVHSINPYEIRKKGLNSKLTNQELATAILHITKRRGLTGIMGVDEADSDDGKSTKAALGRNKELLKDKYVCEVQLERLDEGKVRNHENKFDVSDYLKELDKIFSNQNLDDNLVIQIKEIVKSKREYFDGPGSEKSPTIYGQWYENENGEIVYTSMIDKMRGRCTIYSDELRAPKMSYTACLFNLLNDLNNMLVSGEPISKEYKEIIVNDYVNKGINLTENRFEKIFGVSFNEISGFRINKSEKPIFTKFDGYNAVLKIVNENNLDEQILADKSNVDNIMSILTSHKGFDERVRELVKLGFLEKEAKLFANIKNISGYHSLSLKVMREIMDDLWETNNNQMQIFQINGYFENKKIEYKGSKIPFDDTAILSSVARRSQREALKIVEAIIKKHGKLDSIIIEMPRDKNSLEEKARIAKMQKRGEDLNLRIKELLKLESNQVSNKTKIKIRLWEEQNGLCAYSQKEINLNELISDEFKYEIDHIIPISISFDDSLTNKVLVLNSENQKKGQMTPYQYFKSGKAIKSYEEYKAYVLNTYKNRKKISYLLFEKDVNALDSKINFINRNLVDTQYASRVILNTLTSYFRANDIDTKVHTVRGSATSIFRKLAQIDKDRDEDFRHHAVDALIVAGIKTMNLFDNVLNVQLNRNDVIDKKTGELITLENEADFYDENYIKYIKKLRNLEVKYSHKIDSKINRMMTKETIYSTRMINGERRLISKIDLYNEKEGQKFAKHIKENDLKNIQKFFIYHHDENSFKILENVVKSFPSEKNPFLAYYNQQKDYIRKKSKKGKGPIIRYLKYDKENLGYHNPIGHKYNQESQKVVLLQQVPFRVDVYNDNGQYKFLKINNNYLKKVGNNWIIPKVLYNQEKQERKISDEAQFLFSLYKNDLFYYKKGADEAIVRYNGTMYSSNKIEYKPLNRNNDGQLYLAIGKQIDFLEKRGTDILGNIYKTEKESCKLEF